MKNALIALATVATLGIAPALASDNSFTSGNGEVPNPVPGTLFGSTGLDTEATASIGNDNASGVFTTTFQDRGFEVRQTYTLDADGNKNIISESRKVTD